MPVTNTFMARRREYARFLLTFLFLGFMMKIVSEFIHEIGHASFVLILGGRITGMSISVEWPFTLSHTRWELQNPSNIQIALISVAGIVFDVFTSLAGQTILRTRKEIRPFIAIALFWLSFWSYLSSVVYLVMGAFYPFGDVLDLIGAIPVPQILIGTIGVILLVSYTYSLSLILKGIFSSVLRLEKASEMVSYFWAVLHMFFVSITIVKFGMPMPPSITVTVLVLIFVWSFFIARWLLVIVSRLRGTEVKSKLFISTRQRSLDLATDDETRRRNQRLGYAVLFSAALISVFLTGYMINQYTATYSLVMKTGIEIDVTGFDPGQDEPVLNLSVKIVNPNRGDLMLQRIEFEIKLNQKYMDQQVLRQIPVVQPESEASFEHVLRLPVDRMFTIDQAFEDGRWEWQITGTAYVDTLFGDTLLRFKSDSTRPPHVD
jgi:LEA14-like dessication related protein